MDNEAAGRRTVVRGCRRNRLNLVQSRSRCYSSFEGGWPPSRRIEVVTRISNRHMRFWVPRRIVP